MMKRKQKGNICVSFQSDCKKVHFLLCRERGGAWGTMVNTFAAQMPAINGCPPFLAVCSTRLLRKRQP